MYRILILLLLTSPVSKAQTWARSYRHIDNVIVKKNGDTILSYFTLVTKKGVTAAEVAEGVWITNSRGNRKKLKSDEIRQVSFTDIDSTKRTFVSDGALLKEIVFQGKRVAWIRKFRRHGYDGSIVTVEYLITETGEYPFVGLFVPYRQQLLEATKSRPDLEPEIRAMKMTYRNIYNILLKYDD